MDLIGAAEGTRTPDPRITNAMLYQLSYCGAVAKLKDCLRFSALARKREITSLHLIERISQSCGSSVACQTSLSQGRGSIYDLHIEH